jgi:hypothetical protein
MHSFPSTAVSLLTKLYGLSDYQATLVEERFSGVRALGHALDLLVARRLKRALVAALSLSTDGAATVRLAVALCFEAGSDGSAWEIEVRRAQSDAREGNGAAGVLAALRPFGELTCLPLIRLSMALAERSAPFEIDCGEERRGGRVYISARVCDSQKG